MWISAILGSPSWVCAGWTTCIIRWDGCVFDTDRLSLCALNQSRWVTNNGEVLDHSGDEESDAGQKLPTKVGGLSHYFRLIQYKMALFHRSWKIFKIRSQYKILLFQRINHRMSLFVQTLHRTPICDGVVALRLLLELE